ncbi:MAG: hypothetical protein WD059_16030 [Balneolaceae bacterium]
MKNKKRTHIPKLLLLTLVYSLFAVSCGNDPASSTSEDTPEFPSFEQTQPDLSYFDNTPQKSEAHLDTENYYMAQSYAVGLSGVLMLGQFYSGFFQGADPNESDFRDGSWVWDYTYSEQGVSANILLVATDTGNSIEWTMTMSYDYGDGEAVEDYTLIEGSVAKDESSGTWTFNSLDASNEEIPALVTTWTQASEDEKEINIDIYDETELSGTFNYQENGSEFTLSLSENVEDDITIFWDTDLMIGYLQVGSERSCWDSDFQSVACE